MLLFGYEYCLCTTKIMKNNSFFFFSFFFGPRSKYSTILEAPAFPLLGLYSTGTACISSYTASTSNT